MFEKLKKHFLLLYTLSTGTILSVMMMVAFLLLYSQSRQHMLESFVNTVNSLLNQLENSNTVNFSSLSALEEEEQLIIEIWDNGFPLSFPGSFSSPSDRKKLIAASRTAAEAEGIFADSFPSYSSVKRSSIFTIRDGLWNRYFGNVIVIPFERGYLSLTVLKSLSQSRSALLVEILAFLGLTVSGILLLFLCGRILISKMLLPLEENNQKQVDFVAAASHELRSPLAVTQALSETLEQDFLKQIPKPYQSQYCSRIQDIKNECGRMSELIKDMLLLASVENGSWPIEPKPTDADTFFIESYESLSLLCGTKEHQLLLKLPNESLGTLLFDPKRIYQILQILINNACSYTPAALQIELQPYFSKSKLYIEVIDHGNGIPDMYKSQIFDRYFRMDKARNEKSHFGLGLSIAKELVSLLGGKLVLTDTYLGGCTFTLILPCKIKEEHSSFTS